MNQRLGEDFRMVAILPSASPSVLEQQEIAKRPFGIRIIFKAPYKYGWRCLRYLTHWGKWVSFITVASFMQDILSGHQSPSALRRTSQSDGYINKILSVILNVQLRGCQVCSPRGWVFPGFGSGLKALQALGRTWSLTTPVAPRMKVRQGRLWRERAQTRSSV